MKTLNLKSIMVSCVATVMAVLGSCNLVMGQTPAQPGTLPSLQKEKAVISKDLARVNLDQQRVKALQQRTLDEITADVPVSTRSEIIKARGDLGKAKAYLRADKIDFLKAHQAYIDKCKGDIEQEKADLRASQKKLNAALASGNAMAPVYARQVVDKKNAILQNQTALKEEITSRNNDLLAANEKIRKVKGQPAAELAFEDSWAKTQNSLVAK